MKLTPQITVVIATYNRAAYLRQAIESVLVQSFPDFELLVIDDGSVDSTTEVVAAFDDARIHYIHQHNAGRSVARNHGLALAQGDYIAFLDDDDLYLPHKLEYQLQFLLRHPDVDCVGSEMQTMDANGKIVEAKEQRQIPPRLDLASCLQACPLATCNVLIRKTAIEHMETWFDPEMERAEDLDFFLRLILAGCRAEWLEKPVSINRSHSGNSQQDAVGYRVAYERLLNKLFSDSTKLPEDVLNQKAELYAQYNLKSALRAYHLGQWTEAQTSLLAAMGTDERINHNTLSLLASQVAGFASQFEEKQALKYVQSVFEHLPSELNDFQRYRKKIYSKLLMRRVFQDAGSGSRPSLRAWVQGVVYDPGWLINRGVWSIFLRQILLFNIRGHR
jgi:glycosyltransferase involved in cell wall biosynthesis